MKPLCYPDGVTELFQVTIMCYTDLARIQNEGDRAMINQQNMMMKTRQEHICS